MKLKLLVLILSVCTSILYVFFGISIKDWFEINTISLLFLSIKEIRFNNVFEESSIFTLNRVSTSLSGSLYVSMTLILFLSILFASKFLIWCFLGRLKPSKKLSYRFLSFISNVVKSSIKFSEASFVLSFWYPSDNFSSLSNFK